MGIQPRAGKEAALSGAYDKLPPYDMRNCPSSWQKAEMEAPCSSKLHDPNGSIGGGRRRHPPEDLEAMLELASLGWGAKRIANELGAAATLCGDTCQGGWQPYESPPQACASKKLATCGMPSMISIAACEGKWKTFQPR